MSMLSPLEQAARQWEQGTFALGRPALEPHQIPPPHPWKRWLFEAGRGAGKTEACARYFNEWLTEQPGCRGRIIAPTSGDAVKSCITGPSGLQSVNPDVSWHPSEAGGATIHWPNGSIAFLVCTPTPRDVTRLRAAGNIHIDWWEEAAHNPQLADAWDQAAMGLRMGEWPHTIMSTTPLNTVAYKLIRSLPQTIITRGTMYDNPYNSAEWVADMEARYGGTRKGRQEIQGELLEDVEGALWSDEMVTAARLLHPLPELPSIVTVADPSGSETGDLTGIVTVGRDSEWIAYVLADDSTGGTPEHRWEAVCLAVSRYGSSVILYEPDYGGDGNASNIRSAWEHLSQRGQIDGACPRILPTKGKPRGPKIIGSKDARAQPVVALFEQQLAWVTAVSEGEVQGESARVFLSQPFPELEDQLLTWEPESDWSPDRLDAMVYGVRYLTDGRHRRAGSFGGSAMSRRRIG